MMLSSRKSAAITRGVLSGRLLTSLGVLVLSGCSMIGPDFKTPESSVNQQWDLAEKNISVDEQAENELWWKNFNDPVLEELIATAHEQNIGLQIAGLRVYEARALLGFAAGTLYPQSQGLNASVSTTRISQNADPVSVLPPGLLERSYDRYGASFDAGWELDFWGRFRRGVEAADANFMASIANYDDFLITLSGDVATAYLLSRTLEERLTFAEKNVAIQERSLEIAEVRFRNGLVTELDVQLAKSLLGNTRATIPQLQKGIRQTRLALSLLLGQAPSDLEDIIGERGVIPVTPDSIALGAPADLLRRRPDVRRVELLAAAQSAKIGIAEAAKYPSFRLIGAVGYAAESGSDVFETGSDINFGAFTFNWNFLNYGRLKNNVRVEDARFQQAVAAYQNTVLNAAREVESNVEAYVRSRERVAALTTSVEASRRAAHLAQTQYRDGVISYTLVLDSQQFMLLNEDQLASARGDVARSLVATYKALGGGWQAHDKTQFISDKVKNDMKDRTNWGRLLDAEAVEPISDDRSLWRAPDL